MILDERQLSLRPALCCCSCCCYECVNRFMQMPELPVRSGHLGATGMTPRAAAEPHGSGALDSSLQCGQVRTVARW